MPLGDYELELHFTAAESRSMMKSPMMLGRTALRAVLSPWMILVFLAIGWGPVFVADRVRMASPSLSERYVPQAFAMGWLVVTIKCSVAAGAFIVGHTIRLIVKLARQLLSDLRAGGWH